MSRLIFAFVFFPFLCVGQSLPKSADTVFLGADTIVLFEDKTWEYMHALNFNGVMCDEMRNSIEGTNLVVDWQNDVTFNYDNDIMFNNVLHI